MFMKSFFKGFLVINFLFLGMVNNVISQNKLDVSKLRLKVDSMANSMAYVAGMAANFSFSKKLADEFITLNPDSIYNDLFIGQKREKVATKDYVEAVRYKFSGGLSISYSDLEINEADITISKSNKIFFTLTGTKNLFGITKDSKKYEYSYFFNAKVETDLALKEYKFIEFILANPLEKPKFYDDIIGDTLLTWGSVGVNYKVYAAYGAEYYEWKLPNGWTGFSNTNFISIDMGCNEGVDTLKVIAHNKYGFDENEVLVSVNKKKWAILGIEKTSNSVDSVYEIGMESYACIDGYKWVLKSGKSIVLDTTLTLSKIKIPVNLLEKKWCLRASPLYHGDASGSYFKEICSSQTMSNQHSLKLYSFGTKTYTRIQHRSDDNYMNWMGDKQGMYSHGGYFQAIGGIGLQYNFFDWGIGSLGASVGVYSGLEFGEFKSNFTAIYPEFINPDGQKLSFFKETIDLRLVEFPLALSFELKNSANSKVQFGYYLQLGARMSFPNFVRSNVVLEFDNSEEISYSNAMNFNIQPAAATHLNTGFQLSPFATKGNMLSKLAIYTGFYWSSVFTDLLISSSQENIYTGTTLEHTSITELKNTGMYIYTYGMQFGLIYNIF